MVAVWMLRGPASIAQMVAAPAPPDIAPSADYTVAVGGHPIFVGTAAVRNSPPVSFASFDFAGSAGITVVSATDVQSVAVLPASFGIKPVVDGRTILFTITQPRNLTIEVNGSSVKPLHLFANPLETNRPSPADPHVTYFGPGIHELATLRLHDGAILYLAAGAVVRAIIPPGEKPANARDWAGVPNYQNFIEADGVKNITICGRGIFDLSKLPWHARTAFVLAHISNLNIEGITIIGAPGWDIALFGSSNIHIRNIKEICALENSDGIDICNSQNVMIEDCFLRNNDDEICVKTTAPPPAQPSRNIVVRNCVVWNDRARGLGITDETRRDIDNVLFRNCDIIHDFSTSGDCAALAVILSDSGTVSNIRFEDIRVEDVKTRLIECTIEKDMWGHDAQRGHVKNLTFKNITATGAVFPKSFFAGYDGSHLIENVTFDHLVINGKTIENPAQGNFSTNPFVRNVTFSGN